MAGNRRLRHSKGVCRHSPAFDRAYRSSNTPILLMRKYQIDQKFPSFFSYKTCTK